ncbi:MAG: DMT family transporter [Spirochaetes bacterium]|nr:DMT family transporter [Spirochaetota bacterium]
MENKHTTSAYLALMAAMFFWASSFVGFKIAFQYYHPIVVIWGRMVVALFLFSLFFFKFKKTNIQKQDIKYLVLMALFEPCLYFVFELLALQYTQASQAGMITALSPLMVAIASWFILKERLDTKTLLGFIIATCGVIWLSLAGESTENAPNPTLGNFLEFIAMVCATFYTIVLKKLTARYDPLFLTAVQALVGFIFFTPLLFWPGIWSYEFQLKGILSIIYLGFFVSFVAYGCFNYAVSKIPATKAAATINLIPVICLILAMIILKERLLLPQIFASALVLGGVFLSSSKKRFMPEY